MALEALTQRIYSEKSDVWSWAVTGISDKFIVDLRSVGMFDPTTSLAWIG